MSDPSLNLVLAAFNLQGRFSYERIENILNNAAGIHALFFSEPRHLRGADPHLHIGENQGMSYCCTNLVGIALHPSMAMKEWGFIPSRRAVWVISSEHLFISVYMPTSVPRHQALTEQCYAELSDLIKEPRFRGLKRIIAGDFNARAGIPRDHTTDRHLGPHAGGGKNGNSIHLLNFLRENDLCIPSTFKRRPWASKWTWRHHRWGKTYEIDHFLCPSRAGATFDKVYARCDIDPNSDHRMIIAKVGYANGTKRQQARTQPPSSINYQAFNASEEVLEEYRENLSHLDSITSRGAADALDQGLKVIHRATKKLPKPKRSPLTFLTAEYIAKKECERRAKAALKHRFTRGAHKAYLNARRSASRLKRRDKRRFIRGKTTTAETLFREGRIGKVLEVLRELNLGISKRTSPPACLQAIYYKDTTYETAEAIAEAHSDYLGGLWQAEQPVSTTQEVNPSQGEHPQQATNQDLRVGAPTLNEIQQAIKALRNKKAGGADGLINEALKHGGDSVGQWITAITDQIWEDGMRVPSRLAESLVIAIKKRGKDPRCPSSYRPISLLPSITKVIEIVIHERIKLWYAATIGNYQVGFVRNKQLGDHTTTLRIIAEQERAAKNKVVAVFIDLRKAYDLVDREVLLSHLRSFGLPTEIISLIRNLYTNASFRVRVKDKLSQQRITSRGLMQGSVLSPLMFNILLEAVMREAGQLWDELGIQGIRRTPRRTDDICAQRIGLRSSEPDFYLRALAYADDIVLLANSRPEAEGMLQVINEVMGRNGMHISADKSSWLHLGKTDDEGGTDEPLRVPGMGGIPRAKEARYLGLILNEEAADSRIIKDRIRAAWSAFWKHKSNLLNKGLEPRHRYKLLRLQVFSVLLFGCESMTLRGSLLEKVNKVEKSMMRRIIGVKKLDEMRTVEIRRTLRAPEMTVAQEMRLRRLRFVGHVLRDPNSILNKLLLSTSSNQKGRHKCYLFEIAAEFDELRNRKYPAGTSHRAMADDRVEFRRRTWEFVKEGGVLGKLRCEVCGKEYLYRGSFLKHQVACNDEANNTAVVQLRD